MVSGKLSREGGQEVLIEGDAILDGEGAPGRASLAKWHLDKENVGEDHGVIEHSRLRTAGAETLRQEFWGRLSNSRQVSTMQSSRVGSDERVKREVRKVQGRPTTCPL